MHDPRCAKPGSSSNPNHRHSPQGARSSNRARHGATGPCLSPDTLHPVPQKHKSGQAVRTGRRPPARSTGPCLTMSKPSVPGAQRADPLVVHAVSYWNPWNPPTPASIRRGTTAIRFPPHCLSAVAPPSTGAACTARRNYYPPASRSVMRRSIGLIPKMRGLLTVFRR